MPDEPTADEFVARFLTLVPEEHRELAESNALVRRGEDDDIRAGARMGKIFALAKEFALLPPAEIERLLESPLHDIRVGAVSVMGHQYPRKRTTEERRTELYDLYLRRTDRINTWDLVDVSGHKVVGNHLLARPRDVLYELAKSDHFYERRLAMFATVMFVGRGDLDDTYRLAEILVDDPEHFVNTVVGTLLRETGKHDRPRLVAFLDRHAATMPRITLRFAIEHMDAAQRKDLMGRAKQAKTAG
ncbi:DNA alkylation repair protein [Actinomadura harenae]|uniref:DNA alkylation repair protein n=1 Tax=Actinomadura harenae TaxID=2483351 RepID=A0A3M2LCT2_9ACTN|nr:DNA alkylation repair protein [Actinomadura harenae]RMI32498.1 DNA alkylation repair protein [Actinomadura harenae]